MGNNQTTFRRAKHDVARKLRKRITQEKDPWPPSDNPAPSPAVSSLEDLQRLDRGTIQVNEYVTSSQGRRRRSVRIGQAQDHVSVSSPALTIAYRIRRALDPNIPLRAPVILYDASGQRIGVMDPQTKQRVMDNPGQTQIGRAMDLAQEGFK